jgi:hypothetical protein
VIRISGEPVPATVPEEMRIIVRQRRVKKAKPDERNLVAD